MAKSYKKEGIELVESENIEQIERYSVDLIKNRIADYERVIAEKQVSLAKYQALLAEADKLGLVVP